MSQEESDSEEEILVYAEFEDNVNINKYRSVHVLGVNDKRPIIQMDDTFYIGKHESSLGTYMFFEEDPSPHCSDPLFDKLPEKSLKFVCKTRKHLNMEHAYVTPKEGKDFLLDGVKTADDDVKPVTFSSIQQAVDAFESSSRPNNGKKKCKNMEEVLKKINNRYVKIQNEDRKKNNIILYSVLQEILKKMRSCDKLFDSLKPNLEYLGSYFDGLRVGRPTEYDINIVLRFYLNYNKIKMVSHKTNGAYTSIVMPSEFRRLSKTPATASKGFKETELWCDTSHRLSMQRFRSWMQKVVDSALNTLPVENGMKILKVNGKPFQIASKTSGPAFTLTIIENSDNIIDIDLVPTLAFELPKRPVNTKIDFNKVTVTNIKQYFVVPKPTDDDFSWRLAFPYQEKYYIYNKHNMKSAIKILKLLRDTQGFHNLASYYIKTIFLWEAVEKNDAFWKTKSLSFLVIYMLKKLKECLSNRLIKNFWCPDHNLLEAIRVETCQNWSNRLSYIIHDIESKKKNNPYVILKYLAKYEKELTH